MIVLPLRPLLTVVHWLDTYAVPSSPLTPGTPSLGDSSSEVDELMQPSSPGHDRPLIEEVTDARLGMFSDNAEPTAYISVFPLRRIRDA